MKTISSIISKKTSWIIAVTALCTWQVTDDSTYTRNVIRQARRMAVYSLVNWTANLDDEYQMKVAETQEEKPKTKKR